MGQYFAQYGEDKALNRIFDKSDGIAVEVGGFDGVTGSNTFFFERIGWKTMIIEPNPTLIKKIQHARSAVVFECAVGEHDGEISLNIPTGGETLSSVTTDAWQMQRMLSAGPVTTIAVRQRRLDDVLQEAGVGAIDFITIDVEGYELAALKGFNLARWRPRIVILEDNSSGRSEDIPLYMEQRGYIRFRTSGCNDWYCLKTDPLVTRWRLLRAEGIKALKGFKHIGLGFLRRGLKAI